MSINNSLVAAFKNHSLAQGVVKKLHESGFDMSKLFIVDQEQQRSSVTERLMRQNMPASQWKGSPIMKPN
jgi:hypothetical protein